MVKTWIVNGTYNPAIKNQLASIAVSVERRHGAGGANAKKRRSAPLNATIRPDGTWVATITGHTSGRARANKPKQFAMVVFLDPNGNELWRSELLLT